MTTSPHATSSATLEIVPVPNAPGTVGIRGFRCDDADAGAELLRREIARLAEAEGVERVLAPFEGDTWRPYRYTVEGDDSPPFWLEPPFAPNEVAALQEAGFGHVQRYVSARASLEADLPEPPIPEGVTISAWDGNAPNGMLAEIHAVTIAAFAKAPHFAPIELDAFVGIYAPMLPLLHPSLVLVARDSEERPVGFVMGYENGLQSAPRPAILKTYAATVRGLGDPLIAAFNRAARARGHREVIHALMHEDNRSLAASARFGGVVFRRYALFGRAIGALEDGA